MSLRIHRFLMLRWYQRCQNLTNALANSKIFDANIIAEILKKEWAPLLIQWLLMPRWCQRWYLRFWILVNAIAKSKIFDAKMMSEMLEIIGCPCEFNNFWCQDDVKDAIWHAGFRWMPLRIQWFWMPRWCPKCWKLKHVLANSMTLDAKFWYGLNGLLFDFDGF